MVPGSTLCIHGNCHHSNYMYSNLGVSELFPFPQIGTNVVAFQRTLAVKANCMLV